VVGRPKSHEAGRSVEMMWLVELVSSHTIVGCRKLPGRRPHQRRGAADCGQRGEATRVVAEVGISLSDGISVPGLASRLRLTHRPRGGGGRQFRYR
jgi:hypothetical protein